MKTGILSFVVYSSLNRDWQVIGIQPVFIEQIHEWMDELVKESICQNSPSEITGNGVQI